MMMNMVGKRMSHPINWMVRSLLLPKIKYITNKKQQNAKTTKKLRTFCRSNTSSVKRYSLILGTIPINSKIMNVREMEEAKKRIILPVPGIKLRIPTKKALTR
jgi:hypothetical protein